MMSQHDTKGVFTLSKARAGSKVELKFGDNFAAEVPRKDHAPLSVVVAVFSAAARDFHA
jgi:hypothetical protein